MKRELDLHPPGAVVTRHGMTVLFVHSSAERFVVAVVVVCDLNGAHVVLVDPAKDSIVLVADEAVA